MDNLQLFNLCTGCTVLGIFITILVHSCTILVHPVDMYILLTTLFEYLSTLDIYLCILYASLDVSGTMRAIYIASRSSCLDCCIKTTLVRYEY